MNYKTKQLDSSATVYC